MRRELAKVYSHREVEAKWYRRWEEAGHFAPFRPSAPPFSMVIPPPNVTGSLHMGHALNNTLQDILCRYKRMDGYNTLWVPGTDHAGIATQNVVERQLAEKGLTRWQLGRERFVARVWEWKEEAGNAILQQLRALGVSCDWRRERFTMDPGLSRAVVEAFVRLSEEGLLYRAERLINWCPRCKTALADIEVVHEEKQGSLWYVRYPLADDPARAVVIATTRPETMLGDTAVAVHPEDGRYRDLIGRELLLPIVGRRIPLIADPFVDREFGTGALKITPAHDFNDFEIGERHGLRRVQIFDAEARIAPGSFVAEAGGEPLWLARYRGKDRYEARKLVIEQLEREGLLEKVEPHAHALGACYRCYTPIEPYLTPQWFVRTGPLAAPAIEAVRSGRIRIVPEGWSNSYFAWMEKLRDWCISRQIWWGHQIPAWYCLDCDAGELTAMASGEIAVGKNAIPIVARSAPERCPRCAGARLVRDPDVLDTWFSSALWPFSTLGWPERTEDLKTFYPTSVLVTGFDILFFWVARMIMMGLKFMGEVPFRDVYIHALVRDQEGQKMSKSRGNVIDPLEVMGRFGTDAFRFTLASMAAIGRDIKLSEERIAGYQAFVNKLWNAARFVLMNLGEERPPESAPLPARAEMNLADRWVLSRLNRTVAEARDALEAYRFNEMAHHLYQFVWHEFCDWYIEMSKLSLNGSLGDSAAKTRRLLAEVLRRILLLLHPAMPFVTEEIRQALARDGAQSIMVEPYPTADPAWLDEEAEKRMGFLMDAVRSVRNLRREMNCPPAREIKALFAGPAEELEILRESGLYLRALARLGAVEYLPRGEGVRGAMAAVVGETAVYVPFSGAVDLEEERARLGREMSRVESELARIRRKLENQAFLARAKPEVVDKERQRSQVLEEQMRKLRSSLERIAELDARGD